MGHLTIEQSKLFTVHKLPGLDIADTVHSSDTIKGSLIIITTNQPKTTVENSWVSNLRQDEGQANFLTGIWLDMFS